MITTFKAPMIDVAHLPVEQAVAKLISYAILLPASDIFFSSDETTLNISVRRLGFVHPIAAVPAETGKKFLSHVKALAGMDLAEKRRPLDGRWIFHEDGGQTADLRVNMIPTIHGEDLSLRILARDTRLYRIDELGLGLTQLTEMRALLESPGGLILVTGPTGSGKTATLYSLLMHLNDGRRKINTIEDPVEYAIPGIRQSQINPQIDLDFSALLRGVLRQSPDVIMIGEIRDPETAETAVRAANSGQLVLATIHAPIAAGAVQSMRALGVHPHFLSTSLRGIVSQRLVRTLCNHCKTSFDLSIAPHTFDDVRPWLATDQGHALYAPKGCQACQMTGYSGRTGIFEVMPICNRLRNLIADARPTDEIRRAAAAEQMLEFRQSALLKVAQGITSTEEIFRVIPSEHLLDKAAA